MATCLSDVRSWRRLSPTWRFSLTTGLVALATLGKWALKAYLEGFPFLLSYPVVLLSSLLFGWACGVYALALSLLVVGSVYLASRVSFDPMPLAPGLGVVGFLIGAGLMVLVIETLMRRVEQLDEAQRYQEVLLRELNHRVKNNLQMVVSMLMVQGTKTHNPETRAALEEAGERIALVGHIHNYLYQEPGDLTLPAQDLLEKLCLNLKASLAAQRPLTLHVEAEAVALPVSTSVLIGLLVHELVTNALKHTFHVNGTGTITVRFRCIASGLLCLEVADNGVGCPASRTDAVGPTLVDALVQQLGGTLAQKDTALGCRITVHLPAEPHHLVRARVANHELKISGEISEVGDSFQGSGEQSGDEGSSYSGSDGRRD
jgi:two-component system, sensor histidine kinase PdtaS